MPEGIAAALLIHGAGGGGWEWNAWRDVLRARRMQVAAPDLQPVAQGIAATGLDDYGAQMCDALDRLSRPRALIGASLGGLLAMQLASACDALVLVNPLPPAPWNAWLPARHWPPAVRWRGDARLASTRRALRDADDVTALFAFRHWRDESGAALRQAASGIRIDPPCAPVLCIASKCDQDVPMRATEALARARRANFVTVAGASHVGPLLGRDAAMLASQVADWLSRR